MPNGKVNWQTLHDEIMKQSDERHGMEVRLINALSEGLRGIRDDMASERATCTQRLERMDQDIVGLKVADRKWAGFVGLFAAGLAALAGWLGQR